MQNTQVYLEILQERGKRGLPLERVYRQLFNRNLYLTAYGKIYKNAGALTKGVTDETADGMSLRKINDVVEALRRERYIWKPTRRTYIAKKNGKKRPLGIPAWSNKLVQEVIRMILTAYYDVQFSDHSHGFRPTRSCATALREIYYNWAGTTWFIEGDISQCFDKLDHELLIATLQEKIHDGRFINLIRDLLKAGYLEDWQFQKTLSGCPQGGLVSPVLANILLDKLDKFVETVLIPKYTKGGKRKFNEKYSKIMASARYQRRKGNGEAAKAMRRQGQHMPSVDTQDPDYRRLKYVRYADDWLIGFTGPKAEAEEIKQQIEVFLRDELKLELSKTKTLITHARSEAARFLGYAITTIQSDEKQTQTSGERRHKNRRRCINARIGLQVPKDVIQEKRQRYRRGKKAIHRAELLSESDFSIVQRYQSEYQGLVNYYRLAYNLHTLNELRYDMEISLVKTLAHKHQRSVAKTYKKYQTIKEIEGKERSILQVTVPRKDKNPLLATWGGIPLTWNSKADVEEQPLHRRVGGSTELEKRLLAGYCELCGSTEDIQVHHIKAMKKLHQYSGREKPEWVKRMIVLRRKTMPLCRTCHVDVHAGRPLRRQIIKLEDIKDLQKAKTTMLESRMR